MEPIAGHGSDTLAENNHPVSIAKLTRQKDFVNAPVFGRKIEVDPEIRTGGEVRVPLLN